MIKIEIPNLESLSEAAAKFVKEIRPGAVYAFRADMGAGKTTFISEICKVLGVIDEPSSPTFSIVNEYETESGDRLYHFDCYRIDSPEEAFEIGAEDYFTSGNICFVEWPERIEELLPPDAIDVEIRVNQQGGREVVINATSLKA